MEIGIIGHGIHQSNHAHALVECFGDDEAWITIEWGGSAWEYACWLIVGHLDTETLLFGAETMLRAEKAGGESVAVVSNAAWKAPSGTLSNMFQAGALIELSGDVDTAQKIRPQAA